MEDLLIIIPRQSIDQQTQTAHDNHVYHGQNVIDFTCIMIHLRQASMEPWLIEYGTIFRKETRKDFLLINITETVLRILVFFIATCNNLILTYII